MSPPADAASAPDLPTASEWAAVGISPDRSLHGGHQSHVLLADYGGRRVVAKLTDGRFVDTAFEQRVEVNDQLARANACAVGVLPVGSSLVTALGAWRLVVQPFVDGRTPDVSRHDDVATMASTLASLHETLRSIDVALPPVAALRDGGGNHAAFGPEQLLHGDFSASNVLLTDAGPKVIDYDDCGYGPIEFEIGNTLYMALFDATLGGELTRYHQFRQWFVSAYEQSAQRQVDTAGLDRAIELRTSALARWLDDPEQAPIGIRTSTPAWRNRLRQFVEGAR